MQVRSRIRNRIRLVSGRVLSFGPNDCDSETVAEIRAAYADAIESGLIEIEETEKRVQRMGAPEPIEYNEQQEEEKPKKKRAKKDE